MIRVLVTVGTSSFNSLIEACESLALNSDYKFIFQIGSGTYIPKSVEYIRYSASFESIVDSVDLLITHAGAGSVYSFLEKGKKIVVVPNTDRVDLHQLELSKYVENHNFAEVCYDLSSLDGAIKRAFDNVYSIYFKDDFFMQDYLNKLIISSMTI